MNKMLFLQSMLLGLVILTVSGCKKEETDKNYTLLYNGTIYLDADRKADNLLLEGDRVAGFDVDEIKYPKAEMVDLKGAFAYPGFNDSHVHLVSVAVAMSVGVPLNGASTAAEIAAIVGEQCNKLPQGVPAIAHGFVLENYEAWSLEDLAIIDGVTGDRPVLIADQLGHSYIVNSVAMTMSGLTGETPDPPGGKIIKQNGIPTGMLRETAGAIVGNIAIWPLIPDEMVKVPAAQFFNMWAAMGYTSVVELMGGPMGRILKPGLCRDLEAENQLPLRVYYAHTFFSLDDIDSYQNDIVNTDLVRFIGLKLFTDGAAGNGDAWTSWANTNGGHGLNAIATDDSYGEQFNIFRILEKSEELGLDMHYHTGGDLSIEAVLDAIEAVKQKNGVLNTRHTLYHLGFITDDQINRMSQLGNNIVAGVQPSLHWEYSREITQYYYGSHANGSYPYKKMKDAGVILAFSTDFASTPPELCWPTVIMKVALTGAGDPVANPPLTMRDLITGFTVGGFATAREEKAGTLDIGNKADIVVFSKDLYSVPPEELSKDNPKVLATYVAGKIAYSSTAR